jgi:hypothetical protein
MHKSYLFLGTFLFSNSIFALEKLPMSHTGLEKLKMQEIGYVIKNFYLTQMYLELTGIINQMTSL